VVAKRKKSSSGVGQTIGGILAGFDGQVFRTAPPPHELVRKGDRMPAIPADDCGTLTIELPDDRELPSPDPEPAG
jgi:hypothetical protein